MRFVLQQTEEINYGASHKGRPVKNRKHAECRSISKQKCQEILGKVTPRSVERSRNIAKKKRQIGEGVAIIVFLRMNAIVRQFVRFPHQIVLVAAVNARLFPAINTVWIL